MKLRKLTEIIAILALLALCVFAAVQLNKIKQKTEYLIEDEAIIIKDTIWHLKADTIYFCRYDTVLLPLVIKDTILKETVDSVFVQVPITTNVYDTTITDSCSTTSIKAFVRGFSVSLDTLSIETEIRQIQTLKALQSKEKWYEKIVPAIGVGFGTNCQWGIFIGIGYKIF